MAKSWIESDVYTEWLANIENNENYWKGNNMTSRKLTNKDRLSIMLSLNR